MLKLSISTMCVPVCVLVHTCQTGSVIWVTVCVLPVIVVKKEDLTAVFFVKSWFELFNTRAYTFLHV